MLSLQKIGFGLAIKLHNVRLALSLQKTTTNQTKNNEKYIR